MSSTASSLHAPKIETFDVAAKINIDPKGFTRVVDEYKVISDNCLYMRRGMDHPKFGYLESYLLPDENLRASIYHFRPEVATEHVRYLDMVSIDRSPDGTWHTKDLYVDILKTPATEDVASEIIVDDVDELIDAAVAGLVSRKEATDALETAFAARSGISAHGEDVDNWLRSLGYPIHWADSVTMTPPA